MLAAEAADSDVCAQPHNLPVGAAARVRLPQANGIAQTDLEDHRLAPGERGLPHHIDAVAQALRFFSGSGGVVVAAGGVDDAA